MSLITLPHAVFIYDENGNPVPVVSGSTLTSGSRGFVVYGKDGSNQARNFTVDSSGNLIITGSVTVGNFPATQTITGTVNVNNFPATQTITGTVAGTGTFNVTGTVSVNNQPTTLTVTQLTASNLNATVTGAVSIINFPATQTITGTVAINNFPTTQSVQEFRGAISTGNSTTTPLGVNSAFTGSWEDVLNQASISVIVTTDQIGTLFADSSTDGVNVDRTIQLSSGTDNPTGIHSVAPVARYFRVRLFNAGVAQTTLRLQTLLNRNSRITLATSRMTTALTDYTDVLNTRAAVIGKYQASPITLADGARGDLLLDSAGRIVTSTPPAVRNVSSASLGIGATYTSPTYDTINGQNFLSFTIWSTTDLNIFFDESTDGTNWAAAGESFVGAGRNNEDSHKSSSRYVRLRAVNGTTANAGGIANLYIATSLETYGITYQTSITDENGTLVTADKSWGLRVRTPDDTDAFGAGVRHVRISQISANFSQPLAFNDVTATSSSTGTVTQSSGSLVVSTGAGTTSTATVSSNTTISYTPGREAYALFTAAFTAPTSAASYQRIGLYDASNGFFVGYSGSTFGVTWRQNGVDTFFAKSAWNDDPLVGNNGSFFTRNGVPEAIDLTKKNIWRIRFGWLGAAPIRFDILSPDGRWVRFHTIRYPNTQVAPHLFNPSLPITVDVSKTASDATNLVISNSSWDAGIVDAPNSDLDYTGNIAASGSAVTSNTRGKGTISFNVAGTWTGTLVIQGHNGDSSWTQLTGYTTPGTPVTTITANTFFFVNCAAFSQVRLIATAWTSGTANIQTTATDALTSIFTQTEGNSAAAAADTGNPVKIGGLGKTVQPTAVTDGQRTNALTDKIGRMVVVNNHIRELVTTQTTTITNSTVETTVLTAGAAGVFNDITSIVITNANNQGLTVTIRDATAGTIRAIYYIAGQGGLSLPLTTPWRQTTAANNWTVQLGTALAGSVYINIIAAQNI